MGYNALPIRLYPPPDYNIPEIEHPINLSLNKWLSKHSTSNKLKLYHYTTLEGLKGIITDRSIWCTQINALNDPFEFQYGLDLISKKINHFIKNEKNDIIINILRIANDFTEIPQELGTHNMFITSFCKNDNLLSQWRGY